MTKKKGRSRFIFCCLAPAVILFTIFMLIPTIDVFRMSLYKWGGYTADKTFVGLDNFKTLLQSEKFYQAFQNSVLLIVIVTIVTFAMAIIFAAILTREKLKGQTFFRVVFYIPNILSVVVISAIFSAIYDPNQGLLNSFLNLFRGQDGVDNPILWLGSQKLVIYSIIIAMVWQAIGYYMVMYMASMANIPDSLYESASLEGAGRIKQFFSITLPMLKPITYLVVTLGTIWSFQVFDLVYTLTGGGPGRATTTLVLTIYNSAFKNYQMGYASAVSMLLLAVVLVISFLQKVVFREKD